MTDIDVSARIHCYTHDSHGKTEVIDLKSVYSHTELVQVNIGVATFYFRRDDLKAALAATDTARGTGL